MMRRVQNFSNHISDDDLEQLLPTLLLHLVDRCGGDVILTPADVEHSETSLQGKMVQMLIGSDIRLRIISRPPELQSDMPGLDP